jgi:cell division inhibitor SulA
MMTRLCMVANARHPLLQASRETARWLLRVGPDHHLGKHSRDQLASLYFANGATSSLVLRWVADLRQYKAVREESLAGIVQAYSINFFAANNGLCGMSRT